MYLKSKVKKPESNGTPVYKDDFTIDSNGVPICLNSRQITIVAIISFAIETTASFFLRFTFAAAPSILLISNPHNNDKNSYN